MQQLTLSVRRDGWRLLVGCGGGSGGFAQYFSFQIPTVWDETHCFRQDCDQESRLNKTHYKTKTEK